VIRGYDARMSETRPVLIAGAGPTGLAAAIELARFGVPVRLIDKYSVPPDTSRALAVQSRTVELMQQRGIAGEMLRLGNRGFAATLHAHTAGPGTEVLGKVDFHQIDSRYNFVLLLAQSETERIFREHLERAGVSVERETELIAFSQRGGASSGVGATLRTPGGHLEEVDAAYLIDAEGAHSLVRHSMDLPFEGASLPNTYAVADVFLDGDVPEDELSIYIAETGLIAAFPMGNRRFRIIATEKHPVALDAPAPDLSDIAAAWSEGVHMAVRFRDLQWSSRFRINSRALKQLRHGQIFFAGDSAHIHSPAGGQGMNTGIQDVINLGWKLALAYRGVATDELLDTYNEERLPVIHDLVYRTERATDLVNSNSHFVHTLLRHILPLAFRLDAIPREGARVVSELGVNYRASALSGKTDVDGSVRAGDRFPDIVLADGEPARGLDIIDPSKFTILAGGAAGAPELQQLTRYEALCVLRTVAKPSAALAAALGHATVAVVRPDGYLLCAGTPASVAGELAAWLERWTPVATA
jgi:2-polyprenyl-6-methoxyphenol hydroxylase-like FAD-dependent oxidoreductase